jgi:hypothetical protein
VTIKVVTDNLFERFLFEAPDQDPPDLDDGGAPPDVDDDSMGDAPDAPDDNPPPDMDEDAGSSDFDTYDDENGDDQGDEGQGDENQESEKEQLNNMKLNEKISAIMNMNLYQRYLSLLNNISNQLTMIKDNNDLLSSISDDCLDVVEALDKLDENIHLYLKNNFMNEDYSKNLLFFNKCLNLLKLLNDSFNDKVHKGIRSIK